MSALADFHFLRPLWLLALPVLLGLVMLGRGRLAQLSPWARVVDPALLPFLLDQARPRTSRLWLPLAMLGLCLACVAAAGPAWRQLPQPVFTQAWQQILVMDLSASMQATDLRPSRLERARLAAHQILERTSEGDTGLIAVAAEAFPVVPLTSARATVSHLLHSLDPSIMPRQGENLAAGIDAALALLRQAQAGRGHILLFTDSSPDEAAMAFARAARAEGHRVHVLATGTPRGAPVPGPDGEWLSDATGAVRLAALDEAGLKSLATAGDGEYHRLDRLPSDWTPGSARGGDQSREDDLRTDIWQDEGPWLLLPLLLIAALAFRRGWLFCLLPIFVIPIPAEAGWWQRADQQAYQHWQAGEHERAAETFSNQHWQAAALYEAGEYARAAQLWRQGDSASAAYNLGNALARQGDLAGASAAYAEALARDPNHAKAADNKALIDELLQQQEQQDSSEGDSSEDAGDQAENSQAGDPNAQDGDDAEHSPDSGDDAQSEQADSEQDSQAAEPDEDTAQADESPPSPDEEGTQGEEEQQASLEESGQGLDEQSLAVQQWLNRLPDDPGQLLREKFRRMQLRRQQQDTP